MAGANTGKRQNQERMIQLLRTEQELTKQDIARRLRLSMPTALQSINDLIDRGILEECGTLESTGGRKAKKIRLHREAGLGVGIDIALHHVELVVTDLLGTVRFGQTVPLRFRDEPDWYRALGAALERFLQTKQVDSDRILGVGISFPGIIAGDQIVRSHIFNLAQVGLERFCRHIPYPVAVANDANCACFAELCPERPTYLYISLNESVGGSLMIENRLLLGDRCQAGEIGHMMLIPGGTRCYCGKPGCADAYLSPKVLTGGTRTLEEFFRAVEGGDSEAREQWNRYLEHLAILVTNLRMLIDIDLILGGEVGKYIPPYLDELCARAARYDRFARDVDYLIPCTRTEHAFAAGAAMLALEQYGSRLLETQPK